MTGWPRLYQTVTRNPPDVTSASHAHSCTLLLVLVIMQVSQTSCEDNTKSTKKQKQTFLNPTAWFCASWPVNEGRTTSSGCWQKGFVFLSFTGTLELSLGMSSITSLNLRQSQSEQLTRKEDTTDTPGTCVLSRLLLIKSSMLLLRFRK